ncbi:MAG: NADP-dependent oxidoreductase [Erythrobacter sp.]|nr:NADP-dependent oxidoreductase [Erythrobacter sp.]
MRVREVRLRERPTAAARRDHFEIVQVDLPEPAAGEVQVRNLWMSVDPYMRGRMDTNDSYVEPFEIGVALEGGAIGEVVLSNDPAFVPGDLVRSYRGWREGFNAAGSELEKLENLQFPPEAYLGAAGMPGLTAYIGLMRIAELRQDDVVFVTGAAGAVGSTAVQIAKARGHRVIGSAGGPEKIALLRELGCDAVIDYKAEADIEAALRQAAPDGIDVCFDNVGAEQLDAALAVARPHARFALCGAIYMYNSAPTRGPGNIWRAVDMQITLRGFICTDHLDLTSAFMKEMAGWYAEGKIRLLDTVQEGIANAPAAFLGLFEGRNTGKMLVRLR